MSCVRRTFATVLALAAAGCAGPGAREPAPVGPGTHAEAAAPGMAWRAVRFFVAWDRTAGDEPAWHVDALLADRVVAPVVADLGPRLPLWRVHRRAAPDETGHRFSFAFRADEETARAVHRRIGGDPLVRALLDAGVLAGLRLETGSGAAARAIGTTSDPGWPVDVRRSWPWFIMGASQSWMRLVREVAGAGPAPEAVPALLARYRDVHETVTARWREHGQHVYLHHLNAIFGYQPLLIRGATLRRF